MKENAHHTNEIVTGCLCAAECEVLFGFSYLFTKDASGHASEMALLGWRFLTSAVIIVILRAAGAVKEKPETGSSGRPV